MSLITLFIIWYFIFGKNNRRLGRDSEEKIGFFIVAIMALVIFSGALSMLGAAFSLVGIFLALLLPLGIPIIFLLALMRMFGKKTPKASQYEVQSWKMQSLGLVKSASKRRKIVQKFSKKYGLNLTDTEVERIVEASYVSYDWANEVLAMSKDYESVSEWLAGDTSWLRAYMRAFSVQSISSDFMYQKNICLDSFSQVFHSLDTAGYANIDSCIEDINIKFLTSFDETSFMIAYRFLEANGRKYKLPAFGLYRYESELDKLQRKYDNMGTNMDDAGRNMPLR